VETTRTSLPDALAALVSFLGISTTSWPVERLFSVTGQLDDTRMTLCLTKIPRRVMVTKIPCANLCHYDSSRPYSEGIFDTMTLLYFIVKLHCLWFERLGLIEVRGNVWGTRATRKWYITTGTPLIRNQQLLDGKSTIVYHGTRGYMVDWFKVLCFHQDLYEGDRSTDPYTVVGRRCVKVWCGRVSCEGNTFVVHLLLHQKLSDTFPKCS